MGKLQLEKKSESAKKDIKTKGVRSLPRKSKKLNPHTDLCPKENILPHRLRVKKRVVYFETKRRRKNVKI